MDNGRGERRPTLKRKRSERTADNRKTARARIVKRVYGRVMVVGDHCRTGIKKAPVRDLVKELLRYSKKKKNIFLLYAAPFTYQFLDLTQLYKTKCSH